MASININISEDEKKKLLKAIKKVEGQTISVAKIAEKAKMNPNRVRFIIEDLIEENRLERIATKKFNPRYVRYSYKVKEV